MTGEPLGAAPIGGSAAAAAQPPRPPTATVERTVRMATDARTARATRP